MENYLFYCGRDNGNLSRELLSKLGEYLGEILKYEFIDFGTWRDGCPNDRIVNHERIKGKNIVFFDSPLNKMGLYDNISLCWAFKRQYQAKNLIVVMPFNLLRRCDHDEKPWEIQYLRQHIQFLALAGVDHLIAGTPHSESMGAYCQEYGISFHPAFMDFTPHLKTILPKEGSPIVFYSPDEGSIARAIAHASKMRGSIVLFDLKNRKKNNQTEIVEAEQGLIDEIINKYKAKFEFKELYYIKTELLQGANVVMIDDEMSSGGTANSTAHKLRDLGASNIYFAFTHPVCVNGWKYTLFEKKKERPFNKVIATNTIPRNEANRTGGKIIDVSADQILASNLYAVISEIQ